MQNFETGMGQSMALPLTGMYFWPLQIAMQALATAWMAPEALAQAIHPSSSSLVNLQSTNSSPETDRAVPMKHGYGREIGQLLDVVALLVKDLEKRKKSFTKAEEVAHFWALKDDIDELRGKTSRQRVNRILADVKWLERMDRAAFDELRDGLRKLVAEEPAQDDAGPGSL